MTIPRGIRNNNPGNLREPPGGGDAWLGERATDDDPAFEEFEKPEYGIRALARVLLRYYRHYHLQTINDIIHRWAPPSENDTGSYARSVAARLGIDPNETFQMTPGNLELLLRAIIWHENGVQPYEDNTILSGLHMALKD